MLSFHFLCFCAVLLSSTSTSVVEGSSIKKFHSKLPHSSDTTLITKLDNLILSVEELEIKLLIQHQIENQFKWIDESNEVVSQEEEEEENVVKKQRSDENGSGGGFASVSKFDITAATDTSLTKTSIGIVTQCSVPNTVAITFDDGPYIYNTDVIKQFNAVGAKVTFFMNGKNWDCIYDRAADIIAAYQSGHQIGSHTWSHADLTTLTPEQIATEMNQLSTAFVKILGVNPTYMRPPYGSYNDGVVQTLNSLELGLRKLIMWDVDPGDSIGATTVAEQTQYNSTVTSAGVSHIILQHETYSDTVYNMVPFIIKWAQSRGLKMVTVGQCLNDPARNWYNHRKTPETRNPTWTC